VERWVGSIAVEASREARASRDGAARGVERAREGESERLFQLFRDERAREGSAMPFLDSP